MPFCTNCGEYLEKGKFCSNCRKGVLTGSARIQPNPVHNWLNRRIAVATILAVVVAFAAGIATWSYVSQTRAPVSVTTTVSVPLLASTNVVTPTSTNYGCCSISYSSATETKSEWLPATTQVVSWNQASNYVGQVVTVEGTIVYTYYSSYSGTSFLDFHYPYQGYFYSVIFSSDVGNFKCSITNFYLNKQVRITGTIQLYNGAPEIIVSSPSQIQVAYQGFPCS